MGFHNIYTFVSVLTLKFELEIWPKKARRVPLNNLLTIWPKIIIKCLYRTRESVPPFYCLFTWLFYVNIGPNGHTLRSWWDKVKQNAKANLNVISVFSDSFFCPNNSSSHTNWIWWFLEAVVKPHSFCHFLLFI